MSLDETSSESDEGSTPARRRPSRRSTESSKRNRHPKDDLVDMMETFLFAMRDKRSLDNRVGKKRRHRGPKSKVEEDVQAVKNSEPTVIRSMLLVSVRYLQILKNVSLHT